MIDFELYRIFVAVAKEENITKASEQLSISQPAITKQIKNLENQLSVKLFERKSKGVSLTQEGEYIKLGYLHDVIIASNESIFAKQKLTLENIENQTIYVPRNYAQAVYRIKELTAGRNLKFKNSSYKTILELASSGKALGLITREYVDENDYKKFNLIEVKTSIGLGKVEFGIYTSYAKFKELKYLDLII